MMHGILLWKMNIQKILTLLLTRATKLYACISNEYSAEGRIRIPLDRMLLPLHTHLIITASKYCPNLILHALR